MDKYLVSVFSFDCYEGSRILECRAFTINPLDSLDDVVTWINNLDFKPDHIRINFQVGGCLFDNEDNRISNNVFYTNKF